MSTIYVARHGQDEDNLHGILNGHRDTPLTDIGLAQVVTLAKSLSRREIKIDIILASPLKRAQQTAQTIANTLQLPAPVTMPNLIERDFGVMTGRSVDSIVTKCAPDIIHTDKVDYFLHADKAESFPTLLKRAAKVLQTIEKKYPDQSVLLVTHGDLGKMLYASYYQIPWREVLEKFYFGNAELIKLAPNTTAAEAVLVEVNQY